MFSKIVLVVVACMAASSNAGILAPVASPAHYALTSTSDNILRSSGNLAQIATQSKTISTPYSTSSKSDIRVTNPAIYAHAAPLASYAPLSAHYAAPVAAGHYAAPLSAHYAAPVAAGHLAAPINAHGNQLLGVAYSPAVAVSHMTYSSPVGVSYAW